MNKIFFIIIFSLFFSNSYAKVGIGSEQEVLEALKKGGYVVMIRHAYAHRVNGLFEPEGFYKAALKKKRLFCTKRFKSKRYCSG
jgi:hypothetical protein